MTKREKNAGNYPMMDMQKIETRPKQLHNCRRKIDYVQFY